VPELPEVETVRRGLHAPMLHKEVVEVIFFQTKLRNIVDVEKIKGAIEGQKVCSIERRAKYLLFHFTGQHTLIIHLGMSGSLRIITDVRPREKHEHAIFKINELGELRFRDPRRFGYIDTVATSELSRYPRLENLGFEPLGETVSGKILAQKASRLKSPVKNVIMNAGFIAGIGNIYASEALFFAKIYPLSPASKLSEQQWTELLEAIQLVLRRAIDAGGTTLNDFINSDGDRGYFQLELATYGRSGLPCVKCSQAIVKIMTAGRSTFYCPNCQPQ